ncbi:MAG: VWA domain-containing protein, partial [Bacteroidales bacterium]|nr:VWA domain-containing protein [Bacteroidales bacterium]
KFIPPKKGRSHLLHIIREMLELEPESDGTDLSVALRFLTNAMKKKCTAFLLSDLIDADAAGNPRYEDALKVAAGRHDLSVIRVHDKLEEGVPPVGLICVRDSESGRRAWVNTTSRRMRSSYSAWFGNLRAKEDRIFNKYQIDSVDIATGQDYVKGLMALFGRR